MAPGLGGDYQIRNPQDATAHARYLELAARRMKLALWRHRIPDAIHQGLRVGQCLVELQAYLDTAPVLREKWAHRGRDPDSKPK